MSPEALGRSISDATKFLEKIHEDVRSQIRSLDRLMLDRGWRPSDPNCISYSLGNSLSSGRLWVIDYLQRCFVRAEAGSDTDRVVAFLWYLYHDAGDAYEVPTVAAIVARLDGHHPVNMLLKNQWEADTIYDAAGRNTVPVVLTPAQIYPFLPNARVAAALVVPLCELTSESVLQEMLVEPILTVEGQLGTA